MKTVSWNSCETQGQVTALIIAAVPRGSLAPATVGERRA